MRYVVRALDAGQQIQTLVLEALDEADAQAQAQAQRLSPVSIARHRGTLLRREEKFPLLLFAQELHALLHAGLSVIESLDALIEKDTQPARRAVLGRLAQQLREGHRLSSALRSQPGIFPPLFVGVIQAAEGTSDLPQALARYLDYETRVQSVRHKVTSAAIYPAILLVVGLGVSLFLLGYVVPRFAAVYEDSGRSLPWASQLLMGWGQFAGRHSTGLLAAFVAVAGGMAWWLRRPWRPAVGGASRACCPARAPSSPSSNSRACTSRWACCWKAASRSSRPSGFAPRLSMTRPACSWMRRAVTWNRAKPLSDSLRRHGLSTPVALRLLRVGEQSGQLGQMLSRTAAFYDEETARWIERFTKAFEPVLMAAIGIVIGLIVVLLYMPIFDLAGSLQ